MNGDTKQYRHILADLNAVPVQVINAILDDTLLPLGYKVENDEVVKVKHSSLYKGATIEPKEPLPEVKELKNKMQLKNSTIKGLEDSIKKQQAIISDLQQELRKEEIVLKRLNRDLEREENSLNGIRIEYDRLHSN